MKISDKILQYDIGKQLTKSTQQAAETGVGKQLADESRVEGNERSSGQDTIVNLSPTSKEAQAVKEIISSEPEIREQKVAELKAKIEAGKYKVNHEAVADKMVDFFLDELS